jgi:5-hydroxyisourate hydrolase-like protein (transthyretin family)
MRHAILSSLLLAACAILTPTSGAAQDSTAANPPPSAQSATVASQSPSPDDKLCVISGTVVAAKTGEPVRSASVSLTKEGSGFEQHPLGTRTDADGRFVIKSVPAGQYEMEVSHVGYVRTSYAQSQQSSSGAILTLTPGQKMADLIFRMLKTATISGRLLDQNGDPVQQAEVSASIRKVVKGKVQLEQRNAIVADDRGDYRLWGLPPGRYVITVVPENVEVGQDELQTAYYPGTPDLARASVLELNSGDELTGIDFTLTPRAAEQTFKVRGHITSSVEAYHPLFLGVMLFSRENPNATLMQGRNSAAADPKTGDFALEGVPPGEYVLTAIEMAGETQHRATQIITVANSDVDHINISINSGANVVARVLIPGKAAADAVVRLEPLGDDQMTY